MEIFELSLRPLCEIRPANRYINAFGRSTPSY